VFGVQNVCVILPEDIRTGEYNGGFYFETYLAL
jgi:hypothetical protein